MSIRVNSPEKYRVINQAINEVIEEVEESKAYFEVGNWQILILVLSTTLISLWSFINLCSPFESLYSIDLLSQVKFDHISKQIETRDAYVMFVAALFGLIMAVRNRSHCQA